MIVLEILLGTAFIGWTAGAIYLGYLIRKHTAK